MKSKKKQTVQDILLAPENVQILLKNVSVDRPQIKNMVIRFIVKGLINRSTPKEEDKIHLLSTLKNIVNQLPSVEDAEERMEILENLLTAYCQREDVTKEHKKELTREVLQNMDKIFRLIPKKQRG